MMKMQSVLIAALGLLTGLVGCARITTQVVEKPRVDQELGGNRGFLVGSAPSAPARRSSRKVIQTDIELPTGQELNPWRRSAPAAAPEAAVPSTYEADLPISEEAEELEVAQVSQPAPTTYTVKSGDTLEKISAKVYGSSKQWRRIYEANRDRLSSPNRIYPGQKLAIPSGQEGRESQRGSGDLK